MSSKSTVAIDGSLRKTIKKLAAWLDISQGEVIKRAIIEYEKKIVFPDKNEIAREEESSGDRIQRILDDASERVRGSDGETREIHNLLMEGSETIDDFIIKKWRLGLYHDEWNT